MTGPARETGATPESEPGSEDAAGRVAGELPSRQTAENAGFLSLLFPGLGALYLGHRVRAVLEAAVALFFWLAVFWPLPGHPMDPVDAAIMVGYLVLLLHVPDALVTRFLALRRIKRREREADDPGSPRPDTSERAGSSR